MITLDVTRLIEDPAFRALVRWEIIEGRDIRELFGELPAAVRDRLTNHIIRSVSEAMDQEGDD